MSNTSKSSWFALGIPDILFLILVLGIVQRSQFGMLDDPGLGWHLRNVDAMWQQGGWLMEDPFSGPRAGAAWRTNQWLGDLVLRLGEAWGGKEGIAAVMTLFLAFMYRILYGIFRSDGLSWPAALFWTFWGVMATALSWGARPNVASLLFLMLLVRACNLFHEGRISRRRMFWLVPLMTLWANTHGGFVAGLVTLAATALIELGIGVLAPEPEQRSGGIARFVFLVILFPACVAATLINPYGWGLYPWIFQLLGDPFFMGLHTEWKSPDFHATGAFRYESLMLALPVLLTFSRRRVNALELALCLLWLHFALSGRRYVALWVLVSIPMMARLSLELPFWKRLGERFPISSDLAALLAKPPSRPAPFFWSLVIAVVFLGWARLTDDYAAHNQKRIPTQTLDWLTEHHGEKTILHHYNWGGYVTWSGWPETKNWIDDRNEVQGEEHVKDYFSLLDAAPGWEEQLVRGGVEIVCLPRDTPLVSRLLEHPDWSIIHEGKYAVVLERKKREETPDN
ncbi:hypothetical protein Pan216_45870 [Planctomycetes bacterium Pan216]|uniref:Glycosyltransferase RgtA/B/C/D-like domain-containing protein n=1 Tax=Kolteria novifilia TaxID=2527975 RepID=A0A518B9P3_9BACT|nr:hypothetical protein Pan216_45870 [Planctomycetes bacterium Pan216]